MFTEYLENTTEISGNSLYFSEQNRVINPPFHGDYSLTLNNSTQLDLEPITELKQIEDRPQDLHDPITGIAYASTISNLLPDLTIDNISGGISANVGQSLNFSYTITNRGNALAGINVTKFYLSRDIFLDSSDSYLNFDAVSPLGATMSRSESASVYFNNNINPGTYYLLAQADGFNFATETNETNNITSRILQLNPVSQPDLVIQSVSVPAQQTSATQLDFSYTVSNLGNSKAATSLTTFYLSNNATLDSSDLCLTTDYITTVEAGITRTESASVYLNNTLNIGTYYLIAQADSLGAVAESNENNNLFYKTIELTNAPQPDLSITTLSLPTTAVINTQLNVNYTLTNLGNNQAGANTTKFYLSNDTTLDNSDIYLNSEDVNQLQSSTNIIESVSLQLSNTLSAGVYYLFAVSDGNNCVIESNETNNIAYQTITITNSNNVYSSSGYGLINASAALAKVLGVNAIPSVPNLGRNEWDSDLMNVPAVWNHGYTGQNITVAVLDTGVDRNHLDLSANIWSNQNEIANNGVDDDGNGYVDDVYGWNFIQNNNKTLDIRGHGTHIAGTIAGVRNNIGVTGVAYNSKIMPVKVLDDRGVGNWSSVANGIRYAVNNGAKVINVSLGGFFGTNELQNAIKYASNEGAVVVMAAGNSGGTTPQYPAAYALNWGLAVGSVDKSRRIASWSNKAGNNANMAYLTAPGTGIYATFPNNRYSSQSGTSMAASQVSGVVALLLSANNSLTDSQIRQVLTSTSGNNILLNKSLSQPNLSDTNSTLMKDLAPSTVQMSRVVADTALPKVSSTFNSTQLRYCQSAEINLTKLSFMSALA
ncbi:S8 family serine peptidase [Chroococcus sp. FPU101]|uniref:S8 family serine peptidase n=1 Tax=Chroococcus sp. FPU101 TaxID=1974212 RepID=UPI001A90283D|nr:S8 family serine peptidase [Chroococcus sp. FPU101]GFE69322.1 hypothetical protein CFPU101_19320 [Chroococcus sp. FPU101]